MTRSSYSYSGFSSSILLLISTILFTSFCLTPTAATSSLVKVEPTFLNSTAYIFSVQLQGDEGDTLTVLIEPEEGNATEVHFLTMPSPMEVAVKGLRPDSLYTFTFSLPNTGNSTGGLIKLEPLRTHRIGPQIVGFFAADPEASGDADKLFSVGDVITLAFDGDTNTPGPTDTAEQINLIFAFSQPIGAAYSGAWHDARTLVITVSDAGQSDPMLGYLTVTVIGDIHSPDGLSDISTSSSPPLIGSWQNRDGATDYFRPTDPETGLPIENPDYSSYGIVTLENTDVVLPMSLQFPPGAQRGGYMVSATILYPKDVAQLGFLLNGQNFSYAPSANIGTKGNLPNDFLTKIVPTITLTPKQDYTGYCCVALQLFDMGNGYSVVATAYVNVRIDAPPRLYVPELTASSGGSTTNPIELAKTYKTPLIIGLCVLFGVLILIGLGIFGWKKYRGGRDARDFESSSLRETEEAQPADAAGPTRRFYYDAKV